MSLLRATPISGAPHERIRNESAEPLSRRALGAVEHSGPVDVMQFVSAMRGPVDHVLRVRRDRDRLAPSAIEVGPLGHMTPMREDALGFLLRARAAGGDLVRFRFGWLTGHLAAHPDHVRHILVEHARNYDKQTRGFEKVRLILGQGLLTSEGELWRRQRRIAQPAFHRDRIEALAPVMTRAAEDLARDLAPLAARGEVVDVAARMMRVTLRIAGETLLSSDVTADADVVGRAVSLLLQEANERIMALVDLPFDWPTPRNVRAKKALDSLDAIVQRTIEERRRMQQKPNDLLTLLMDARDDETGERMSDRQLRDEVMTIFLAGHETTANAMVWTLHLLSKHPEAARKLRAELRDVLGGRAATAADVPKLVYTTRVIKESLRLFPPAWIIGRRAIADDTLDGRLIPRGSLVFVSPWVTHRHPDFWDNPEGFDPDRFTPERFASIPRYAYAPFGAGPRICIGGGFAMLETAILLGTLAQSIRFDLIPGREPELDPSITLRPRGGLPMVARAAS
jgi:cytochrome P450